MTYRERREKIQGSSMPTREKNCLLEDLTGELIDELDEQKERHMTYLDAIGEAIGDDREKRFTGEVANCDAWEIRRLRKRDEAVREWVENSRASRRSDTFSRTEHARGYDAAICRIASKLASLDEQEEKDDEH